MVAADSGRVPVLRDFGHVLESLVSPYPSCSPAGHLVVTCHSVTRLHYATSRCIQIDTDCIVGGMSRKKQFQTRLDPDVADRVEQYADENDLSNSEAVRRLVRQGIEASGGPTREEIAADLEEVRSAVRGVRRELDTDDDPDGQLQRAGQVGTVVSVVVTAVLTGLTVLVVGGLL